MKAMIEQHRNSLFENSCAIVTRSLSSRGVWELTCHYQFFKIQLKIPGGVHNHTRPLLNWAGRRGRRAQTQMCNAVCSTLASPLFAPGVRRRAARNSVSLLLLLGCLASAHRAFMILEMLCAFKRSCIDHATVTTQAIKKRASWSRLRPETGLDSPVGSKSSKRLT